MRKAKQAAFLQKTTGKDYSSESDIILDKVSDQIENRGQPEKYPHLDPVECVSQTT
jgi:hypothetical protein